MTLCSRSLEREILPETYVIELRKGRTYFHAMFYDVGLTFHKIDTFVYIGRDTDGSHQFQDAASYAAQQESTNVDEIEVYRFSDDDLSGVVDKEHLIEWLQDEHSTSSVGPTYEYREID